MSSYANILKASRVRENAGEAGELILLPEIAEKFGDSYFSSIENSMYVATCNRLGEENVGRVNASYCGGSWLIDPKGCVVGSANGQEMVLTLEIANDLVKQKKIIGVDLAEELSTISSRLNQG